MEDAHARDVHDVAAFFRVDLAKGLSDYDVQAARAKWGRNELPAEEGTPLWRLILKQFDDLLVKILLAAAFVDLAIGLSNGDGLARAMVEPCVILAILIANATVGVVTERNAEQAIEELKAYEAARATVLRNGAAVSVPSSELVPGDVVEVGVGDQVPADLRVARLLGASLRADQSILTGESSSVEKGTRAVGTEKAVYQDKVNLLFAGTLITSGRAHALVVATGPATAMGRIRGAMRDAEEVATPLQRKLDEFGTLLSKVIAGVCILVWLVNAPRFADPEMGGLLKGAIYYFKIAVALAVAAIPEGLPAVVTTCLALGTRKMAKLNAIVRSLPSVETLGCTTVIASDKTGTLTTNAQVVSRACFLETAGGQVAEYVVTGTTYNPEGTIIDPLSGAPLRAPADAPALAAAAQCAALCNDSVLTVDARSGAYGRIGEATEAALRVFAEKVGLPGAF